MEKVIKSINKLNGDYARRLKQQQKIEELQANYDSFNVRKKNGNGKIVSNLENIEGHLDPGINKNEVLLKIEEN